MTYKEALERILNYNLDSNARMPGNGLYCAALFQEIAREALMNYEYCKRPAQEMACWTDESATQSNETEPIDDDA